MAKPERGSGGISPEEGLLERASKRIEEAPGTNEGRAAIAKAQELLALPDDQATRSEAPMWSWHDHEKKIGSVVTLKGSIEQGIPWYRIERTLDGQISEVSVDVLIPDPKDPLKLISEGLVGRSETFNAQGELIGITVNTFNQRGKIEKQRRERKLNDGSKKIEIFERTYGQNRPKRYTDLLGEQRYEDSENNKMTNILMGPDGKLRQARITEEEDEVTTSIEFIDHEQGKRFLYNKALGINRVEPLAA